LVYGVIVGVTVLAFLDLRGDWPAHCELQTPFVWLIRGCVVMNRLGSSDASAPTHGVSKCFVVFSAP